MLSISHPIADSYITDSTIPWSDEPCELILRPSNAHVALRLNDDDKYNIIRQIAQRCLDLDWKIQPNITFEHDRARISSLNHKLLNSIWKDPPEINGAPMEFVSRGMPWKEASIFTVDGLPSMDEYELTKSWTTIRLPFRISNRG